jgi:hypothetical protein
MVELIWTELAAPHPVVELVSALESGTEFFEAETAGRNSPILRVCRGRDRVIRTIQPACFDIAEVSRVPWRLHNYRVWMVGATGIEPVTPSMSTRCLKPNTLRLLGFLETFVMFFAVCSRCVVAVRCRRRVSFSDEAVRLSLYWAVTGFREAFPCVGRWPVSILSA